MSYYSPIMNEIQLSRRLLEEIVTERRNDQHNRIQAQLQNLRISRHDYIDKQAGKAKSQYEKQLEEDEEVAEEHKRRKQRNAQDRAKMAQFDFQKERERLIKEREEYKQLQRQYSILDKGLLDLQTRSKMEEDEERKRLIELQSRKKSIMRLLEESKSKEVFHLERAKNLLF